MSNRSRRAVRKPRPRAQTQLPVVDEALIEELMRRLGEPTRQLDWSMWDCPLPGHAGDGPLMVDPAGEHFFCASGCGRGTLADFLDRMGGAA